MRVTLTIVPGIQRLIQREIRRTDTSMKAIVNDGLRLDLGMRGKLPRPPRFKVKPHAFGFKPEIDPDRLNRLVDELEADEHAQRLLR